ncbi:hypothetical protein PZ897_11970 [Hoeflea sp. YIM 152468]|uniref:hypothetical protein n=1 Tax=Hoeflea sp. YIM 152468 TaxID=3031759 RepID=UPI0023D9E7E9|nr:hypothetical protein [Hoeflea sp. YIM 152468]MDF1608894.1 hypothetical protein [Hoeflea sp. YIM 152468]
MDAATRQIFETGTTQTRTAPQSVRAGDLSAVIDQGALRRIALGPVEVVRQIDFPVRDENWATLQPEVISQTLNHTPDGFRYERHFEVADGALACHVVFQAHADGTIVATGEAEAKRDFITNRTGFSMLHPISGVAGRPVTVATSDGTSLRDTMPEAISPAQPIRNIAGLAFDIHGMALDISFQGDVFEMEDQRNWSDASYKTYSRPLIEPFAYEISAGTCVRQQIRLRVSGSAVATKPAEAPAIKIGPPLSETLPDMLLAAQGDWLPTQAETTILRSGQLGSLLLRTTPDAAGPDIETAAQMLAATGGSLDLEIELDGEKPAGPQLDRVVSACRIHGVKPRNVIALPSSYLASYQPSGRWPGGLSPLEVREAARKTFPDARIGCGMLTNFTELNRCRPGDAKAHFITHGNSATVHAADDWSVMQTLETLPDIFASARGIGGELGYRLGLTAIGMRSNPYGNAVSPNPDQLRLTMATWDPRARALFGAAWAIGALAKTEGFGIEAIALAAPAGPFGVISRRGSVACPWYDDHPEAVVYPMFHALNFVAGGGQRFRVFGGSAELGAVAFASGTATRLVIANLSPEQQPVRLGESGRAAILDTSSFEAAVTDPQWFAHACAPLASNSLYLDPWAMLFVETDTAETPAK